METSRKLRTGWAIKLIHCLMFGGGRTRAVRIFDAALEIARRKIRGAATLGEILAGAIENARPVVAIERRRVGKTVYRVPMAVSKKRSIGLGMQ